MTGGAKKTSGRPSLKTDELTAEILRRLIESDGGLEGVCKADDMPHFATVYRWLGDDEAFREAYMRAREVLGDVQAFKAVGEALLASDAALGRLRYDARKWAGSRLNAKQWGDKLGIGQADGFAPVSLAVDVSFVAPPKPA